MKKYALFYLFIGFSVSTYAQQFSFTNEDGVIFDFEVERDSDKLSLRVTIENTSSNVNLYVDSSGVYSFTLVGDTAAFMGVGFDYALFPYANDGIMRRTYKALRITASKKITQSFTHSLEKTEQVKILRIGFDYLRSNKEIDFNEKNQNKISRKRRYFNFNFTLPLI